MQEIRNCGFGSRCMKHVQGGGGWSAVKCVEMGGANGE